MARRINIFKSKLIFISRCARIILSCVVLTMVFAQHSYARTLMESQDSMYNLNMIGFAHIDIADFYDKPEGGGQLPVAIDEGFQEARMALHLSSRLGHRISVFVEAEATATEDDLEVGIERAIVKYDIDNSSQISVGRYHAPVGFWNQNYHHGRWLQVTKDRPAQTDFGAGFFPAHYEGAMYERRMVLANVTMEIDVGYGAGRASNIRIPEFFGPVTVKGDEAFVAQISINPKNRKELTFGGSLWLGDLTVSTMGDVGETILTAHVNYVTPGGEFIAEASRVQHKYGVGNSLQSYGGYVQYNHRLISYGGKLQPYVRLDFLDIDKQDFVFSGLRSIQRQSLGMRIDVTDNSAFKLEIRRDEYTDTDQSAKSLQGQYAIYF